MQKLANGSTVGAYTILRLIGRGGMGEIYEAEETSLGRKVALKIIAPQDAPAAEGIDLLAMFLNEARTLAQVNHPNVVTIHTIQETDGNHLIAMEYVEGVTFKDVFKNFAFSAAEAGTLFWQMLEGVAALHARGIVHRDLKPQNLMLLREGRVKILDFGIATHTSDIGTTQPGRRVGTLSYMAPEVVHGGAADFRSDLWALGAIFYEAMVGMQLATLYTQRIDGVRANPYSDVVFPQECLSRIPPQMRSFIGRMCEKTPELRYVSAAQAAQDLRLLLRELPLPPESYLGLCVSKCEQLNQGASKSVATSKRAFLQELIYPGGAPDEEMTEIVPTPPVIFGSKWVPLTLAASAVFLVLMFATMRLMGTGETAAEVYEIRPVRQAEVAKPEPAKPEPVRTTAAIPPPETPAKPKIESKIKPPAKKPVQPEVRASKPVERPPQLRAPKLVQKTQKFSARFNSGTPSNWPVVSWRPVQGARGYKILFSKSANFKDVIKAAETRGTMFEWQDIVPGTVYWKVVAIGHNEEQSSETGSLQVNLPPPSLSSTYTYNAFGLEWEAVPLAPKYIVQWSSDKNMSSPVEKATPRPQASLPMKSGLLYVRVAAADQHGKRVSAFSRVTRVTGDRP